MLRSLRIQNLVLIREAELALAPGLNAITGETGAGKTILAQAIGLLLGARGDAGYVGPGAADEQLRRRAELRRAWRDLAAAGRRHEELARDAAGAEERLDELLALVEATEGLEPGQEDALRDERERLRHVTELVEAAATASE